MSYAITSQKRNLLVALFFAFSILFPSASPVFAQAGRDITPPTFSKCEDKMRAGRGDRVSQNSGKHPIPGREDFEGRNDIYTLSEGNFVQCSCETNGTRGVQTNWWSIQGLPLGRVDIDAFERAGWNYVTNGSGWGLLNAQYLAKTSDVSCSPSSFTAAPTSRISVTPQVSGMASSCRTLSVNAVRGIAPFHAQFTINGTDPNGQIQEYELDTGDLIDGEEEVIKGSEARVTYTYQNPGTYQAAGWIKDSQGEWKQSGTCKKTIVVTEGGRGGGSDEELPETGLPMSAFWGMMIVGEVGYLLYKKYQLV